MNEDDFFTSQLVKINLEQDQLNEIEELYSKEGLIDLNNGLSKTERLTKIRDSVIEMNREIELNDQLINNSLFPNLRRTLKISETVERLLKSLNF